MRIEEGRSMKDIIVRLDINYDQHYEPSGSRNGSVLAIGLSYRGDLAVREVDLQAAPVAYRVKDMTGLPQCSERVAEYEIRSFAGALCWPLVGDEGLLSVSTFLDLAAAGHASARLTFDPDAWRPYSSESSTADVYFTRHRPRKLLESNQSELWNRVLHGASGVIFCGGFVYVDAGEPAWFGAVCDDDRLVFRIGCSSLDRAGSIYHQVPGPWQGQRSMCAADGLTFSLDEFEGEVRALREQTPRVQVHSEIEPLTILHRPDAAALLCEQALARSFWHPMRRRESWSLALQEALPALATAHAPNAFVEDLNCREVVAQLASLEVGDDTEYDEFIMTARSIRKRLASFGVSLHAEEDDDALGELARLLR